MKCRIERKKYVRILREGEENFEKHSETIYGRAKIVLQVCEWKAKKKNKKNKAFIKEQS